MPDVDATCASSSLTSLNLKEHNIKSINWTTGFSGDFNYIKPPVLDGDGNPKHQNGLSGIGGLYLLGLHWLRTAHLLINGVKDDAEFISKKVYEHSLQKVLESR